MSTQDLCKYWQLIYSKASDNLTYMNGYRIRNDWSRLPYGESFNDLLRNYFVVSLISQYHNTYHGNETFQSRYSDRDKQTLADGMERIILKVFGKQ